MKILTWNIAALPSKINILGNLYRLTGILDKIYQQAPQVICLQEVFDYKFQEKIIDELKHQGYYTHQSKKKGLISKNGLLTATQDNIRFSTEKDYSMFTGAEYLIKGLLTTYIKHKNKKILIHNTHLQSNSIYHLDKICTQIEDKSKKRINQ